MFRNEKEFKEAAAELLKLVDAHDRGEITTVKLLREWKKFMRQGGEYLKSLEMRFN